MTELQPIIVFHGRHLVRHLGIWNLSSDLCQTLTDYVRCYFAQFKKNDISISNRFLRSTNAAYIHKHTHTHTHTHDDSIRRNAMRRFSPKNKGFDSHLRLAVKILL